MSRPRREGGAQREASPYAKAPTVEEEEEEEAAAAEEKEGGTQLSVPQWTCTP